MKFCKSYCIKQSFRYYKLLPVLLLSVYNMFYVWNNCLVRRCWNLSLYVCYVLSINVVVQVRMVLFVQSECGTPTDFGFLMCSLVYPHSYESSTHWHDCTSGIIQWEQVPLLWTYRVRETFDGKHSVPPMLLADILSLVKGP